MVQTRAALEKMSKNDLISLFIENNDKVNDTITELGNKLAKVSETLERMESQQAVSKAVIDSMHKRLADLEKQCCRNAQYSKRECIEIVGIPDNAQEEKVCELVSSATGVSINPDSLESCHHLPSKGNNKIILKFSRRKDVESVLRNRTQLKNFNPRRIDIDSGRVYVSESLC